MIKKFYRKHYQGEFIIKTNIVENGVHRELREWVPNTIENLQTSNCAAIIGNGLSRRNFDLGLIKNHRGGHLGKFKLQSYGCNALYRDFAPDFLVCVDSRMAAEVVESGYADNHIVISGATNVVKYPGKLHLVPYNYAMNSGSMATYLACFDGHKKIFLLGFDNQPNLGLNSNIYAGTDNYDIETKTVHDVKWINYMTGIFNAYDDVEFYRVVTSLNYTIPEPWKYCVNFKQINYRDFVLLADL